MIEMEKQSSSVNKNQGVETLYVFYNNILKFKKHSLI